MSVWMAMWFPQGWASSPMPNAGCCFRRATIGRCKRCDSDHHYGKFMPIVSNKPLNHCNYCLVTIFRI